MKQTNLLNPQVNPQVNITTTQGDHNKKKPRRNTEEGIEEPLPEIKHDKTRKKRNKGPKKNVCTHIYGWCASSPLFY